MTDPIAVGGIPYLFSVTVADASTPAPSPFASKFSLWGLDEYGRAVMFPEILCTRTGTRTVKHEVIWNNFQPKRMSKPVYVPCSLGDSIILGLATSAMKAGEAEFRRLRAGAVPRLQAAQRAAMITIDRLAHDVQARMGRIPYSTVLAAIVGLGLIVTAAFLLPAAAVEATAALLLAALRPALLAALA